MIDLRAPETKMTVGETVQPPFDGVRKRKITSVIDQESSSGIHHADGDGDKSEYSEEKIPLFGRNISFTSSLFLI